MHNVSLSTMCVGVLDACIIGERVVLGPDRVTEANALSKKFSRLWRNYVWGQQHDTVMERGTFSAIDNEPERYCSYNSTIDGEGPDARCVGDSDEGDTVAHWININTKASRDAIWSAPWLPFGLTWFPTYPQSFAESFTNNALSLYEMAEAGWLPRDTQLLPASSWYDFWYEPFAPARPLTTLQRLEQQKKTLCFRRLAVCHLDSFVFDDGYGAGHRGPGRRPWSTMQAIVEQTRGLRRRARLMKEIWRKPALLFPQRTVGDTPKLRVLVVERRGMSNQRNILNARQIAHELDGDKLGMLISAEASALGKGFAKDAERVRGFDVLLGAHGGDLINALCMHRGSSAIEVRGYRWRDDGHGVWPGYYARLFGLDHAIYHYVVQLSLNDTMGAPAMQAANPAKRLSPHATWSLDMVLPIHAARAVLTAIIGVGGNPSAYNARNRDGDGSIMWVGRGWGGLKGPHG